MKALPRQAQGSVVIRYVVAGRRGWELRSQTVYSAKEGVLVVDAMIAEGFTIDSVIDRLYRPISLDQLRADAKAE